MTKLWRVIVDTYLRQVLRKGFWFGLLSVPALVALMVGTIWILFLLDTNTTPIGYVDHSGLLAHPLPAPSPEPPDQPVPMLAYPDEASAQQALEDGKIQAYYVLAEDYLESSQVKLVYAEAPKRPALQQFRSFMVANLLADQPPALANRVVEGSHLRVQSPDGSRQMSEDEWFTILVPIIAGLVFYITITSSAGYFMHAVVEEKENRTMEIMLTSISPNQLMAGKTIGVIGVGLTQLLAWLLFIVAGVMIGQIYFPMLRVIHLTPDAVVMMVAVMVPSYVMLAGLMAAIGATVTEAREGQQVVGLITLPLWLPYILIVPIMASPNSPLAVGLSLFPVTAPMAILLRASFAVVPAWQITLSVSVLALCALGSLWLAGRTFRLGMLMYGKKLAWREVFSRR